MNRLITMLQHILPSFIGSDDENEPIILPSALKHGVSPGDILHAWRESRGPVDANFDRDPPTVMYIGLGASGAVWYEIGVTRYPGYDRELVVHAMKARKGYLTKEGLR